MKPSDKRKIYKPKDIDSNFMKIVDKAKDMWTEICNKNFEKYGDEGSCVVGSGIKILYIPKGCRNPRFTKIISQDSVSSCQGSLNWERGVDDVVKYLIDNGIECTYSCGRMD